ncbi:hypothetical protein [Maribacter sp. 2308TA10-17]|uniref:hypothetical protein n=1 Tax=Maribacter sp. 2308TA10-17 TaxID=3386276 RepID=UPI0039BD5471
MLKKIVFLTLFSISLLACDSDFKQGNCDEGQFEQTDGNGGTICAPITDVDTVEGSILDDENLNGTD